MKSISPNLIVNSQTCKKQIALPIHFSTTYLDSAGSRFATRSPRLLTRPINAHTDARSAANDYADAPRSGRANSRITQSGNGTSLTSSQPESVIDRAVTIYNRGPRAPKGEGQDEDKIYLSEWFVHVSNNVSRFSSLPLPLSLFAPPLFLCLSFADYHREVEKNSRVGVERARFLRSRPDSSYPPPRTRSGTVEGGKQLSISA